MFDIGICGHFGGSQKFYDGQTIKTKVLTEELKKKIGVDNVTCLDTYLWKKNPLKLLIQCLLFFKKCKNIVILPAHNGVIVFVPLFSILKAFFQKRVIYVVVGGWLPDFVKNRRCLLRWLHHLDFILVETPLMQNKLTSLGLRNVKIFPNFREFEIIHESELFMSYEMPYKFCTFSRVVKEKGIEDAINAVKQINQEAGEVKCKLDIYGHIYENYNEEFKSILATSPEYIVYKGSVQPKESVQVLKNYYIQLFPTKYKTEGIPGSIIDSYFAGLPVLASKWQSYYDVIDEGKTGVGFELGKYEDLVEKMKWAIDNPDVITRMKKECLKKAREYTPENVIGELLSHLK